MPGWKFLYLLILAVLPLAVNPWANFPYEIPKQLILDFAVVLVLLYFIFAAQKRVEFLYNRKVAVLAGLWLLSLVISTIFSVAPAESFWGSTTRMQGLFTWILYLVHFFICLQIFAEEKWRKMFFDLVSWVGLILSFYAILQHFGVDPLNISNIDEASGRSFGTIGQPSLFGQWLIFPFMVIFMRIFEQKNSYRRFVFLALLLTVGAAIWTTLNRASMIGILISLLLFLFHKFRKKISGVVIAGSFIFLIVVAVILVHVGGFRSIGSRLSLIKPVAPLIQEYPLFGAGPETTYQTYQKVLDKEIYLTENLYDVPDRIHVETLQVLLDQGVFGLILYFMLIVFLLKILLKKDILSGEQNIALFSVIAYMISVQFSFSLSAHMVALLAMLAIVCLACLKFEQKSLGSSKFRLIGAKIAAFLISIFYLWNGIAVFMADIYFYRGIEEYFSMGDASARFFDQAIRLNPHSRYYLYSASNLLEAKGVGDTEMDKRIGKYLSNLGEVINYSYHYDLAMAQFYERKGDAAQQEIYYQKAAAKAPNWPFVWAQWGQMEFKNGLYEKSIEKYAKLAELAPPYWKWSRDLDQRSFAEREKHRLFKKNNSLFYVAMNQLASSYEKAGNNSRSEEILQYLR